MLIRAAQSVDVPTILELIQQKAIFDAAMDACDNPLAATEERLRRTLFNGDSTPFAHVLLARRSPELAHTETKPQAVGFALYYFRYSSFRAQPSLWLDDLFVIETERRRGVGTALLRRLVEIAQLHECSHIAWTACVDNAAGIRFYHKQGAEIVDQRQRILYFQLPMSYSHSYTVLHQK